MNPLSHLFAILLLFFALVGDLPAHASVESTFKDNEGLTAYLRTPTQAPDPTKTYWLLVSVHGVGASGHTSISWFADWQMPGDVVVLAPTFKGGAGMKGSYQMSGPTHEAKLGALIAEVGRTWKLHPKIILNGFSAGAQFVHRYAFHHPDRVAGVAAHSGGSWAKTEGDDAINPAALGIPFAVSCGGADTRRLDGARTFASALCAQGFDVDFRTWPGLGHEFSPGANAQTRALVERIRTAPEPSPVVATPPTQ